MAPLIFGAVCSPCEPETGEVNTNRYGEFARTFFEVVERLAMRGIANGGQRNASSRIIEDRRSAERRHRLNHLSGLAKAKENFDEPAAPVPPAIRVSGDSPARSMTAPVDSGMLNGESRVRRH